MIKNFYIGNFKAFGKTQKIPIKPITLIFGPNSSGKSSILQSLLFAQHINKTGNLDVHKTESGEFDLGGFPYYMYNHNPNNILTLGFDFTMKNNDGHYWPFSKFFSNFNLFTYKAQFKQTAGDIKFHKCKILFDNELIIEFSPQPTPIELEEHLYFYKTGNTDSYSYLKCNYIAQEFIECIIKYFSEQKNNKNIVSPDFQCNPQEIEKLKKSGKKFVYIKEGVRFGLAFFLALIFSIYFPEIFFFINYIF